MPKFEVELYVGLHLVGAPTDITVVDADNPEEAAFFALGEPLIRAGAPGEARAKVSSSGMSGRWQTTVLYSTDVLKQVPCGELRALPDNGLAGSPATLGERADPGKP
jgi:hypothetical protein